MKSLNRVQLLGNLGRDAETKFTPSGVARTQFSIATTRGVKKGDQWEDETDWTNVVLWRNENLAQYLLKGTRLYVEGRISSRSYEKDGQKVYVTEVVAEDVILCGGKDGGEERMVSQPRGKQKTEQKTFDGPRGEKFTADDDDVPF